MKLRYSGFQPSYSEVGVLMNRFESLEEILPCSLGEGDGHIGRTPSGEFVAAFEWGRPGGPLRVFRRGRSLADMIRSVVTELKGMVQRPKGKSDGENIGPPEPLPSI